MIAYENALYTFNLLKPKGFHLKKMTISNIRNIKESQLTEKSWMSSYSTSVSVFYTKIYLIKYDRYLAGAWYEKKCSFGRWTVTI